ncbi:MAG TPA: hypothetical protein VF613_09695 [Longimicrobium sp.]|jgi:hypothetical protein
MASRIFRGIFVFGTAVLVGSAYLFARSLARGDAWWMVLGLAVLCVQGMLVLGMIAYALRTGAFPRNKTLLRVSSTLTWVALLLIFVPTLGVRVLAAIR